MINFYLFLVLLSIFFQEVKDNFGSHKYACAACVLLSVTFSLQRDCLYKISI
uniref:Uncharacterized protein n=1 Tax=Anguilla anguilla TaxID=7936 RepID=A0A0E9VMZ8_ANGAN